METPQKKILIIDDHSIVRMGIYILIKKNFDFSLIFEAATLLEAKRIIKDENIDYILLDINLPDGNSLNFVEEITLKKDFSIKILIFSGLEENIYALKFIEKGVGGFLSKLCEEEQIVNALSIFFETGKYISENLKERMIDYVLQKKSINPLELLSTRELEIARLLSSGVSNTNIALKLRIQKSTVSTYKSRIFDKMNIDNIPDLIKLFNLN